MTAPTLAVAQPTGPRFLLSIRGTAEALSLSERTVYALTYSGDLEGVHVGRKHLITVASIEAYVDRLRDNERFASSA